MRSLGSGDDLEESTGSNRTLLAQVATNRDVHVTVAGLPETVGGGRFGREGLPDPVELFAQCLQVLAGSLGHLCFDFLAIDLEFAGGAIEEFVDDLLLGLYCGLYRVEDIAFSLARNRNVPRL